MPFVAPEYFFSEGCCHCGSTPLSVSPPSQTVAKPPIKYVVTFTNLKFRLVTPYRSLVIGQ